MTMPDGMTCQGLIKLVTDYFEKRLSIADRMCFEAHLGICSGCLNYLDQMRRIIQMVGALEEQNIPDEAKERLLRTFRDWKRTS